MNDVADGAEADTKPGARDAASDRRRRYSIGVDTGGTSTDIVLADREVGRFWTAKTLSTPDDPSRAFIEGIRLVLEKANVGNEAISHVFHGTTVATNAILEGAGAKVALLTTRGFRHSITIARQDIPRGANLYAYVKPQPPVPASRIFEVDGRMDADGEEVRPLSEADVRAAAEKIKKMGVDVVAICFLHSYMNAAHERRVRDLLAKLLPDMPVTLSSDVLPVFREYERGMTILLNGYVMPLVSVYVRRLQERLDASGIDGRLLLMKSNGGVAGAGSISHSPVHTALSGPAAGAMGVGLIGRVAGHDNVIGIDIGGTSADITVVQNGTPSIEVNGQIGDWPLQFPMVNITTIGAGGGSIARVTADGQLHVGPVSAGAAPGPACYGRGGTEPTVTDARLVLGQLPTNLFGGRMTLYPEKARQAVETVARALGLSAEAAAEGILAVADNNMVGAIRQISVQRGLDPREFTLVPFGGAGPLHGSTLARLLGIKTIVVPPDPGVLSALGLLVTKVRSDYSKVCVQRTASADIKAITDGFEELEANAQRWLEEEDIPLENRELNRWVEMRYLHQGSELRIEWPAGETGAAAVTELERRFHTAHESSFTFKQADTPVEMVTLMVEASGLLPTPRIDEVELGSDADPVTGHQEAVFDGVRMQCPVLDRGRLRKGARFDGPAIVTQLDCTTVVLPGQKVTVDHIGNLIVRDE